jgi:NDP-sugar pyrophosphorylase family protein
MSQKVQTAIILAHGVGEKCFPFGGEKALRPKYAHEVGNIPLVTRAVQQVQKLGIENIYVVAGFRAEKIFSLLPETVTGIQIENFARGDAVALSEFLKKIPVAGNALILNADLLAFEKDFQQTWQTFQENGKSCVLVDELHPEEDKLSWPGISFNAPTNRVTAVTGPQPDSQFRLSGLYVFTAADLAQLAALPAELPERLYLFQHLQALKLDLVAVNSVEPLVHVDRTFDYLEANQLLIYRAVAAIPAARGVYVFEAGKDDPDPHFIFPGTIVEPGARIVFEANSFVGPFQTREAHLEAIQNGWFGGVLPIRIRGNLQLGENSRIGLNSIIEGNLVVGRNSSIEDSIVEPNVLVGDGVVIRRNAVIRGISVCGDRTRFECAADFEGVAGKGTIYMHPGQCWIVTGQDCDLGAGNYFGTWRFDSGRCKYVIGGRSITPKRDEISNASFIGDGVRTAIGVFFLPGTRVGADSLVGAGCVAQGTLEGGFSYYVKPEMKRIRVGLVRPHKK